STTSQRATSARPDGFTYYGSAWYERQRAESRTPADSSRATASLRERTIEPIRVPPARDLDSRTQTPDRGRTVSDRIERVISPDQTAVTASTALSGARPARDHSDDGAVDLRQTVRPSSRQQSERSADASGGTLASASVPVRTAEDRSTLRRDGVGRGQMRPAGTEAVASYSRPSHEPASRVVINGDNNIIVQGDISVRQTRPYITPHHIKSIHHIRTSPYWVSCGSGFVFHWSNRSCGVVAVVPFYNCYGVTYYYPRYHRRFVFVSLGGYWPSYRYVRYYWYGAHPYYWYGSYVLTPPTVHNTYNTYNTYTTAPTTGSASAMYSTEGDYHYDPAVDDFSDVRQRLAAEQDAVDVPYFQTAADLCFAHAVELFEAGNYDDAAKQFAEAIKLSPDDSILPFTYAQALFAMCRYDEAADVLRAAMARIPAEEPTVYYPRGLYADDKVLTDQVAALESALAAQPNNTDYHLLLGYHYLALGEYEKATILLHQAAVDEKNLDAVAKLLDLADRLQSVQAEVL
ncbi:MAG: tetratricopeptide repeat protein, partial [Planctomycetes bacterium]|nr:tetratricopeptide repeat protein [Planctomycetota bacterium]